MKEMSLQEILEDRKGACCIIGELQTRTVWTRIVLCVDDVPWRNTVAEKEHKPV